MRNAADRWERIITEGLPDETYFVNNPEETLLGGGDVAEALALRIYRLLNLRTPFSPLGGLESSSPPLRSFGTGALEGA